MLNWIQVIALSTVSESIVSSAQSFSFRDATISTSTGTVASSDSDDEWSAGNYDDDDSDESLYSAGDESDTADGSIGGANKFMVEATYTNWVGPSLGVSDTACYREAHITKTCPLEFDNHHDLCWAECPLSYPVKCGMECIRQIDDCAGLK
ncbi:hypothetical protein JG687_00004347 [Phytophthora cactorum]|uniref:Uncharacterized protein n=1 Tax=Phytophthora cactorum TaxID=29920 RepID=A0A329SH81_9STRA|nr:hypothetical protein JG687_00004347 [Phytophthora cactorum]RAW34902.1 hypothetical protein PC110_g8785 [Phytophthora cactorum]